MTTLEIILLLFSATLLLAVPIAFAAGYVACYVPMKKEMDRLFPMTQTLMGMTAQRLNYNPQQVKAIDHAKPQNSIDQPAGEQKDGPDVVHLPSGPDLFRRRQEAFLEDEKEWKRSKNGQNAEMPVLTHSASAE